MTFITDTFLSHWKGEHNQVKSHWTCGSLAVFFIYKVVHCLNDFWNVFLDKVYH